MQQNDPWAAFNPQPAGQAQPAPVRQLVPPAPPKPNDPPSGYVPDPNAPGALTYIPGGPADPNRPQKPPKDPQIDANERKAAGFAKRAIGGFINYRKNGQGARSLAGQVLSDKAPDVLSALPEWMGNSDARRLSDQAELEFISAQLRLDSGATIPPEEIATQRPTWFPRPGDTDPGVLSNYDEARKRAVEGMIAAAGDQINADPELRAAIEEFKRVSATPYAPPETVEGGGANLGSAPPPITVDIEGGPNARTYDQMQADERRVLDARVASLMQSRGGGAGTAGVMGAVDGVTMGFGDEIAAGGNAFIGALQGEGSIGDLYSQNIGAERGYREQLQNQHGGAYLGGQLLGGLAIPFGAGASGARGLGIAGAAQGGAYGFGSSEGNALERLPGAFTGAAIGGAAGAGLGAAQPYAANALLKFGQRPSVAARQAERAEALPVIEAGQRQNIPIRQPDARPSTRADFAAVEASETGNPIVLRAMQDDEAAVQNRVGEVGGKGKLLDEFELGQRLQKAGEGYLARTGKQADALYERARTKAAGAKGDASEAVATIDNHIAELRSTGEKTNADAIKYLEDLKSDLAGGASIDRLRNIRKNIRGQISSRNLTATDTERRVGDVMSSLGRDVERILPPEASAAFKGADKFYRERMQFKDQVIRRFVGRKDDPVSPETAAQRFNSFMRSKDFGRFARMMKELEPSDRTDIAATVAEGLGKARNGEFSMAALSTNIDKFSPRALKEVFGDDGARAIADLKIIARAKADTSGALNNSRTGVVNSRAGLKDIIMGAVGGGVAGLPGALGGVMLRRLGEKIGSARQARLLLNPDFTKWLKQTPPSAKPAVINAHFARLARVAANDTVFAADVKALQSSLAEAFAQSPGRAAAGQDEQD
jgi:hypothetical protein